MKYLTAVLLISAIILIVGGPLLLGRAVARRRRREPIVAMSQYERLTVTDTFSRVELNELLGPAEEPATEREKAADQAAVLAGVELVTEEAVRAAQAATWFAEDPLGSYVLPNELEGCSLADEIAAWLIEREELTVPADTTWRPWNLVGATV